MRCFAKCTRSEQVMFAAVYSYNEPARSWILFKMSGNNNDKLLNKMAVIVAIALLFLHETAVCNPKFPLWAALLIP